MGKRYDVEYKEYVCRLVVEEKRKMSVVSRELDIPYDTLVRWVRIYKKNDQWRKIHRKNEPPVKEKPSYRTPSDYEKEPKQREKDIARLQEENDILKKAMHVFTKNRE
ncbi:transposase [Atopococcus tabaci]|uniref:transposase n=1 Tax=Atopococcus tabaci TaxID=269774 RepID=UPI00240A39FD|nr:transposase [Atopococcus tabaci]